MNTGQNEPVNPVAVALFGILYNLAVEVETTIKPYHCALEALEKSAGLHYRVPDGKPSVIAFAHIFTTGRMKDNPKRPCIAVNIVPHLLTKDEATACKLEWKEKAHWRVDGEWQGAIYQMNDERYVLVLRALVTAAQESLRRAGLPKGT
ncbi:MAG: hypothetical protein V3U31_01435 [Dehalococcoidia bacterium]